MSACVLHEKWCNKNPENYHDCWGCLNLHMIDKPLIIDENNQVLYKTNSFRCIKLNKNLYPYIVNKKKLLEKYPETFKDQELMPSICKERNL